jgi:two-component system, NtrC family, sensor histidine kinase KinB
MKTTIRSTRFTVGIILFLVIILLLSVLSAYYLNMLSRKTSAILKENHYSVVFARDMAEDLSNINQQFINCLLIDKNPETASINQMVTQFTKSLKLEKNNITEVGEEKLVSDIETGFTNYYNSIMKYSKTANSKVDIIFLQNEFESLYQKLMNLSQMNERAIEVKTDDAKVSAKKASVHMTIAGTLLFLIAYGFTFGFASYFNERFYQLYSGIKQIPDSKYKHRLNFDGNDEINDIALIINKMADRLTDNSQEKDLTLQENSEINYLNDIRELKAILIQMKSLEEQAKGLISKLENKL